MALSEAETDKRSSSATDFTLGIALVALLAIVSRTSLLAMPPLYDEWYHIHAARSLVADGSFRVLDGAYLRAADYTRLIGAIFEVAGTDALWAARLSSAAASVALTVLLFAWTWTRVGALGAITMAGLVLLWPDNILYGQFIRFYSIHTLLTVVALIALYEMTVEGRSLSGRATLLAAAAGAAALAARLQMTTAIALAAVAAWFAIAVVIPALFRQRHRWTKLTGLVGGGLLALFVLYETGLLRDAWAIYRWAPAGAPEARLLYPGALRDLYPVLFVLLPVAAIAALRAAPRLALFAAVVLAVGLVLFQFAGMRDVRYIAPIMPAFFLLWAIVAERYGRVALDWLRTETDAARIALASWLPPAAVKAGAIGTVAAGLIVLTPAFQTALQVSLRVSGVEAFIGNTYVPNWGRAPEMIAGVQASGGVVVTTRANEAIGYLGGFDYGYSARYLSEIHGAGNAKDIAQFSIDPRDGRPVISTPEALQAVMACHPTGLFQTSWWEWDQVAATALAVTRAASALGYDLTIARPADLVVATWRAKSAQPSSAQNRAAACRRIPQNARRR